MLKHWAIVTHPSGMSQQSQWHWARTPALPNALLLMKTRTNKTLLTTLTLVIGLAAPASWALPRIKVLATGGTIAGAQTTQADAGYKSGTFSVDDLIKAVPQLKNIAELSGEQVANIGSQTMNHEVWLKLAAASMKC